MPHECCECVERLRAEVNKWREMYDKLWNSDACADTRAAETRLAKVVETAREVLAQGSLEYRAEHSQRCDCPTCRLYHLADAAQPEEKKP